jgi:apolipoprotein N-acyltransferase
MYKNYLLSILTGLLLAISWPTYGFPLFLFIAFVPLLIVEKSLRSQSLKHNNLHTFFNTYLAFFIWNVITTWWIWNSTSIGAIFALVVNSLIMTLVFQLYHVIAKRKPRRFSLLFLVALWIGFEKFHLNWDFSWPWLNLGNAFSDYPQWIQWYEYTGVFGGSLWIWIVNIVLFLAVDNYIKNKNKKQLSRSTLLAISIVVLGSYLSIYQYHTYIEKGEKLTAIVIQPNTDPYSEKYHQSNEIIAENILNQTQEKIDEKVDFVLAPETVFSNYVTLKQFYRSETFFRLNDFYSNYPNTSFITGIDLYKTYKNSIPRSKTANTSINDKSIWYETYNAALLLAYNQTPQRYNKSKLVVGVEHFPFRSILKPLLGDVMIDLGGTISTLTPQKEVSVFKHQTKSFIAAPVICYESIYGEFMGQYVKKGANFFAIITNDSWWGETQGHKQLLSYARLRAIEHRRAIARSANSGISSFINQKGDIIKTLPYLTKGSLKGTILANNKITFYSQNGDIIARVAQFVAVLFFIIGLFVKKKVEDKTKVSL